MLFVDEMLEFEKVTMAFYYDEKRLQLGNCLGFNYNQETHCHICKKPFDIDNTENLRD